MIEIIKLHEEDLEYKLKYEELFNYYYFKKII